MLICERDREYSLSFLPCRFCWPGEGMSEDSKHNMRRPWRRKPCLTSGAEVLMFTDLRQETINAKQRADGAALPFFMIEIRARSRPVLGRKECDIHKGGCSILSWLQTASFKIWYPISYLPQTRDTCPNFYFPFLLTHIILCCRHSHLVIGVPRLQLFYFRTRGWPGSRRHLVSRFALKIQNCLVIQLF